MTTPTPPGNVTFYDPLNPPPQVVPGSPGTFNHERWARVGATGPDLTELYAEHEKRTPDQQVAENTRLRQHPDDFLRAELDESRASWGHATTAEATERFRGGAREVLAEVNGDPAKAQEALVAEQARPTPRVSVLNELQAIIASAAGQS